MYNAYLLIDFGSTYTKLTLVDIDQEIIIGTSNAITTVDTNIMIGFEEAFAKLNYDQSKYKITKKLACSSAAGGLKMVTLGLVPELTVEASKRAALGAGARVLKTYSYEITNEEILEIKKMKVDIILLSGGTNGGNKKTIINNAKKLADHFKEIPMIIAGNKCANDEIKEIFDERHNTNYIMTENVMPSLNEINVIPVREKIREIFMKNIIKSKGMDSAEEFIDGILMPTPAAVLKGSEILAKGTDRFDGIGDLIVVDIGGATTDVHSLADGYPTRAGINLKGLKEPYAKRTVEGDLGMRYSALSLLEASKIKNLNKYLEDVDFESACQYRHDHIDFVPLDEKEIAIDGTLAKIATKLAMDRHVGNIETVYTPLGEAFNQIGKDLLEVNYLIGTGGVIIHSNNPEKIMLEGTFKDSDLTILKPKQPNIYIDKLYILSAMGLLSFDLPDCALKMMKKYILGL
ncbi:MAG: mutL 2 [Haloplasmataceae bacterium]|nr:mutL 2 [Haloplasmataceae bacterium]